MLFVELREMPKCPRSKIWCVWVSVLCEARVCRLLTFSVLQVLAKIQPDEVYNLGSSVGLSFEQPVETLESITTGTLNLLETFVTGTAIKLYNAGSSDVLGILVRLQLTKPRHSAPGVPMPWLKQRLLGSR